MCPRVLDICTARIIKAYPELKAMNANSLFILKLESCASAAGISSADLLRWSITLTEMGTMRPKDVVQETDPQAIPSNSLQQDRGLIDVFVSL